MGPEFFSAVIGVGGGLVGVFIGMALQQRSNRARLAFDMHAEFNNGEFARARSRAAITLKSNPSVTFSDLTERLPEDAPDVWLVVRFYEKLWVGIKHGYIQKDIVPELFGSIFFWWYLCHYKEKLVHLDYPASINMKALKAWFDDFTEPFQLRQWEKRASL